MHLTWSFVLTCFVALCHPGSGGGKRTPSDREIPAQGNQANLKLKGRQDKNSLKHKVGTLSAHWLDSQWADNVPTLAWKRASPGDRQLQAFLEAKRREAAEDADLHDLHNMGTFSQHSPRKQARSQETQSAEWQTQALNLSSVALVHEQVGDMTDVHESPDILDEAQGTQGKPLGVGEHYGEVDTRAAHFCLSDELSCRNRCGRRQSFICSCDIFCKVYRDCCEDYFVTCDIHPDELLSANDSTEAAESDDTEPSSNDTSGSDLLQQAQNVSMYHDSSREGLKNDLKPHIFSYAKIYETVGRLQSFADVTCVDGHLMVEGCLPDPVDLSLLPPGLNYTDEEVRRFCWNASGDTLHEMVPVKGMLPTGYSFLYKNVFCAVCTGCVKIFPLSVIVRRNDRLDTTTADPFTMLSAPGSSITWHRGGKLCYRGISLPSRRTLPRGFRIPSHENATGSESLKAANVLLSSGATGANSVDASSSEHHTFGPKSASQQAANTSALANEFSEHDRDVCQALCDSFIAYVEIPAGSSNVYRNKYCYLASLQSDLSSPCKYVGQQHYASDLATRVYPYANYSYLVSNLFGNVTVRQMDIGKDIFRPIGKSQVSVADGPKASAPSSDNSATNGQEQSDDMQPMKDRLQSSDQQRLITEGNSTDCEEGRILVNFSCVPTMYRFHLGLQINFTGAQGSEYKSKAEEADIRDFTENMVDVIEGVESVSRCVLRDVLVEDSVVTASPHQLVQFMTFECHVGVNDTSQQRDVFIEDMTAKLKKLFENLVDFLSNPASLHTMACIQEGTSEGEAQIPSYICSQNKVAIVLTKERSILGDGIRLEGYISITCCVLSDMGLLLRIALQCVVPFYGSYPGKIQFCLCLTLMLAYTFFLIGGIFDEGTKPCEVIGIFTHVAFLSALSWMNVTAFEIWRTFKDWRSQVRPKSNASLILPAFYALAVPLAIVGSALLLDHFDPGNHVSPAYGVHSCWLSRPHAVITFFVVPCTVICVINAVFVTLTLKGLRKQRGNMVELKKSGCGAAVSDMTITMKIVLLVGVTWLIGLVAAVLDYDIVWIIFTIVNASLGFMIAMVLLCNKRVLGTLKRSCGHPQSESTAVVSTQVPRH